MASSQAAMLANVLHRVRLMEESQSRSTAMLNKLRLEMEDVASRLHKLDFSHKSAFREINSLLERFGEQMAVSREKEQEKARVAFLHLRGEMEEERNACSVLKMRNKKLTKDLTHANVAAADTCKELGRERKARELLEEVCNELAREIGEDKAEVEQLKQEQEESRKRLEKELKMMRMAALWREEGARSKLFELELDDGKRGMPLQELEACANTVADACEGSQEEIEKQAKEAECLTQALERASSKDENQLDGDEGKLLHGDRDTMNGIEHRMSVNETRKPCKLRRRMRKSGKQRHNVGIRIYDQKNSDLWNTHCGNSIWPSSEDEPDRRQPITLWDCTPRWKTGHVVEGDANDHNLHVNASSTMVIDKGSQKKHSSSARFAIGAGREMDCKSEGEMGRPSIQYSFSEDDAANYIGIWTERKKKEGALDAPSVHAGVTGQEAETSHCAQREDHHLVHHHHDHLDIHKSTGRGEESAEDIELDDFCFEPVRGPANASNHKEANKDENGVNIARLESSFSHCSDEACCGLMANCSHGCKHFKDKVHKKTESITILASPELSNVEGAANAGGQETMNKMSPWRSASTKPRPCFWPPSPDRFSIFGGAKKCSKAGSPAPGSTDGEQHTNIISGPHPHAHRHTSPPARQATHQPHLICVKSNSLGAQLIKAREFDTEKSTKSSFRFSPLRRATSHG
eukprot:c25192_g1_i3 orf=546-2618(+)